MSSLERTRAMPRRRVTVMLAVLAGLNLAIAAALIVLSYVTLTALGQIPDFAAFWAAGRLTLEGAPALAYDWQAHRAVEVAGLGREFKGWMPWHYPPYVQLALAPLAALPLFAAMALWVGGTGALFLWTCWRIVPHRNAVLAGLAAAPTALTLINGQIGFLMAALLGLALLELERRPARAGVLLGLLGLKPHLVLALPVVLIATMNQEGGRWRAVLWATATVAALAALAWAVLGGATWAAFIASIGDTARVFAGTGEAAQRWAMAAGTYGGLRYLGAGFAPALAAQGAVALVLLVLTVRAWRAPGTSPETRAALLCFAAVATAPRVLNYDLHILLIGMLFQCRHALAHGFRRGEQGLLAGVALAAFASMLAAPGVNPVLALALFAGCWLAQVRGEAGPR